MKKLLMSVITLSVAASAWGQTFESKEMPTYHDIIPKSLAYEGKSSIVIPSEDDENTVDIYDSNLEKVRSITITPSVFQSKTITQKRKVEVIVNERSYLRTNDNGDTLIVTKDNLLGRDYIIQLENGNFKYTPDNYWEYDRFGETYPLYYILYVPHEWDGIEYYMMYDVYFDYKENKTDEWETIDEWESSYTVNLNYLPTIDTYEDYDNNIFLEEGFKFTQTLFNTDEKYEYIIPLYEEGESIEEYQDKVGNDMRRVTSGAINKGLKVVNEDGTTVCTLNGSFNVSNYEDFDLIKIVDKTYLVFKDYSYNTWYLIDQQSSSIESVKRIPTGKSQIYSVDGRKLNNTQRGINIIRKDDGSSTKQLIR